MLSGPSYGPDVALAAVLLAESGASGLIHVSGPEILPRDVFARSIASAFGLDPSAILSAPASTTGPGAARPLSGGLRTPLLDAFSPSPMRPLAASLADFLIRLDPGEGWSDPRSG